VETVLNVGQITRDQREQVGRLGKRVVPDRSMPAVFERLAGNQVTVAQQYRVTPSLCIYCDSEHRHDIRPVQVVGDLAEALRLTLGTKHGARLVEPLQ